MAKRPSLKTKCVAASYAAPNERIAEFSSEKGGGLIGIRTVGEECRVEVYRCDSGVSVIGPPDPVRDAAPDMLAALKLEFALRVDAETRFPISAGSRPRIAFEAMRDAIAKAEGRANA